MVFKVVYDVLASFTCPRTITFMDWRLGFTHKALVIAIISWVGGGRELLTPFYTCRPRGTGTGTGTGTLGMSETGMLGTGCWGRGCRGRRCLRRVAHNQGVRSLPPKPNSHLPPDGIMSGAVVRWCTV
jgi:hypothetical protein